MMDETINARLGRMMIGQGDIVEYRGRRQRVLCTRDFGDDKECYLEPERRWVKVSELTLAANPVRPSAEYHLRLLIELLDTPLQETEGVWAEIGEALWRRNQLREAVIDARRFLDDLA